MKVQSWGEIKEVDREIANIRCLKWFELYHELQLRLERTDSSRALSVPFGNVKVAESAKTSLQKQFQKSMPNQVRVSIKNTAEGAVLFVCWADEFRHNPGKAYHRGSKRLAAEEA
jgi:hypothetical protein